MATKKTGEGSVTGLHAGRSIDNWDASIDLTDGRILGRTAADMRATGEELFAEALAHLLIVETELASGRHSDEEA
ncbi:hypothetical protein [Nocardia yamanashiensis]|uniref:hypothetical protein n=1 Tax=Nocardia yamanashiensis TaxID=209247 RepID=UPI0012FD0135|nr:hypothetical protein [Nocardia yamanashiensis]